MKPGLSTSTLNADSYSDSGASQQNATEEISKFFISLLEKKKAESSSKSVDLRELIRNQHWYFIKFLSFCKCDVNPIKERNYMPYWVLAEVTISFLF